MRENQYRSSLIDCRQLPTILLVTIKAKTIYQEEKKVSRKRPSPLYIVRAVREPPRHEVPTFLSSLK